MDNFQFWLYVIIGIIYILSKLRSKPKQEPSELPEVPPNDRRRMADASPSQGGNTTARPMTFEDLLREISEGKTQEKREPAPEQVEVPYVNYDEDLKDEAQDLEDESYDYRKRDKVYEDYEEAKRQAFYRPSLEETMSNRDTDTTFGRFKGFEQVKERNLMEEYLSDLKDPEGLKKAFVMSEVFKRKF